MPDEYSAIRQLCERYVDAVNRRDAEAWVATWAPDGVFEYGGEDPPRGQPAMARFWDVAMENMSVLMTVASGLVERVDGDSAKARWYHTEDVQVGDEPAMAGFTVYDDDLVRINGEWRFARRTHQLLYSGELSGTFHPYQPQ